MPSHWKQRLGLALFSTLPALALAAPKPATPLRCPADPVTVQVLGSSGPIAEGIGAAASYLVRIDGVPRLLIDAGPGSFLRFGEAGATVATLQGIALSHLHADHTVDLPGILNMGAFEDLGPRLLLIGPNGAGRFPGTTDFVRSLVSRDQGAWRYLGGYLDGAGGSPQLDIREVKADRQDDPPQRFAIGPDIFLTALPVHHGDVPALGFLVEAKGKTAVFAGDQNAESEAFASRLAGRKPDLMIVHHVIPEGSGQPIGLHRSPTSLGELAGGVAPRRLVLAHNMKRSLDRLDEGVAAIRTHYRGALVVAHDLDCYGLGK